MNKNKQINLRLSEKELDALKNKAKGYPTLSAFILDACFKFDDELGIKRIQRFKSWSSDFLKFDSEISRVGNNINQLNKLLYKMTSSGIVTSPVIKEILNQQNEIMNLFTEILNSNIKFKNDSSKFLHLK